MANDRQIGLTIKGRWRMNWCSKRMEVSEYCVYSSSFSAQWSKPLSGRLGLSGCHLCRSLCRGFVGRRFRCRHLRLRRCRWCRLWCWCWCRQWCRRWCWRGFLVRRSLNAVSRPSVWRRQCRRWRLEFPIVIIDKGKPGELFLVDSLDDGRINWSQSRLFRREVLVKVCCVGSRFLRYIMNRDLHEDHITKLQLTNNWVELSKV